MEIRTGFFLLVVGAALGAPLGAMLERSFSTSDPEGSRITAVRAAPSACPARPVFTAFGEKEIEEYHQLKSLRERYEKADELLGKALLVMIADFGLKVGERTSGTLRESAAGVHKSPAELEKPLAAFSAAPVPPPAPTATPAATMIPAPSPLLANTARHVARPPGHLPFGTIPFVPGHSICEPGELGWYFTGQYPGDYRTGIDRSLTTDHEPIAYIESRREKPRGSAELNHCADLQMVAGKTIRVTAWVKIVGATGRPNLHLFATGTDRRVIAMNAVQFPGNEDWKAYTIELAIPRDAVSVSFGVTLGSAGKMWVRMASLELPETDAPR